MIIASAFPVRALIVASLINFTTSFLAQRSSSSSYLQGVHTCFGDQQCINRIDSTALSMDFGKFFNDAFGMDDSDDKKKKSLQSFNEDDDEDEDDDEHGDLGSSGLGCTNIFKIEGMKNYQFSNSIFIVPLIFIVLFLHFLKSCPLSEFDEKRRMQVIFVFVSNWRNEQPTKRNLENGSK